MADNVRSESLTNTVRRLNSKRSISIDTDSNQNEVLDPRIYAELEKLNKTSDDINFLERESDQLRAFMQQTNAASDEKLRALAEKLGSCVGKAKPYYDARIKLREIQIKAQGAAQRFEMSCGDLSLAKEMVHVAEDCYAALGSPDDSAWQEMLNHSTGKVNEAELERKKSELEHEKMTQCCAEVQREVSMLQKEQKRSIAKSRQYFEMKAKVIQEMEGNKKKLTELESSLADAKTAYSKTLRALERISDEIHQKRQVNQQTIKRISRHEELNHPVNDSKKFSSESTTIASAAENDAEVEKIESADLCLSTSTMRGGRDTFTQQNQTDKLECSLMTTQNDSAAKNEMSSSKTDVMLTTPHEDSIDARIQPVKVLSEQTGLNPLVMSNQNQITHKPISTGGLVVLPKIPEISLTVQPAESNCAQEGNRHNSPEPVLDPSHANAEVMRSIMRLKSASISPPVPFLSCGLSQLGDDNSDRESITSSYVNANVLSDEQIESLMLETADYKKTLERMDPAELNQFKGLELPAKLSYLQDYVNFDPIWIEDDFDNFDKKAGKFIVTESN